MTEPAIHDGVLERTKLAVLLRRAAGATARDWVMADRAGREVIHACGRVALVEAAGLTMAAYLAMPDESAARSAVLLSGARRLRIPTDWWGWP